VTDEDLPALYNGADLFCFPSLYEGFGLPVLEAMACGTPVVTSNSTSLPEVAGEAALLVDPYDVEAIAEAMRRVLEEPELAAELRERGLKRAAEFTWERTARETSGLCAGPVASGPLVAGATPTRPAPLHDRSGRPGSGRRGRRLGLRLSPG
jgi:glycosyltransferase involved in cell wall biosynthesis